MQIASVESEWVVTLVSLVALLAGVSGAMSRAARRAGGFQDAVEARWREAADRLGGRLEVSSGGKLTPRRLTLVVERDDVSAALDVNVPVDEGAPSHTRARARFALGAGPVFRLRDRVISDPVGRGSIFDPGALARGVWADTGSEAATASLFSPAALAHIDAFRRELDLRSDGVALELVWSGVEQDAGALTHAIGLVAELAQCGVGPLRALASLEDAVYVPVVEGGPLVRVRRDHADVEVAIEMSDEGPRWRARVPSARSLPELFVRIDSEGVLDGALPPGVIDPEAAPLLSRTGACTLASTSAGVELVWAAAPSSEQVDAGTRLVASVAVGSARRGAFR